MTPREVAAQESCAFGNASGDEAPRGRFIVRENLPVELIEL